MHVSACFPSGSHTLDLGWVFEYSYQIRRHEKYDVHGKMFDTVNLPLTKRVLYLIWYNENKIAFCYKKGCFIEPQNQRFRLIKNVFFSHRIREKGVFQAWVRGSCMDLGVCRVCVCVVCVCARVCWGGGGGGGGGHLIVVSIKNADLVWHKVIERSIISNISNITYGFFSRHLNGTLWVWWSHLSWAIF